MFCLGAARLPPHAPQQKRDPLGGDTVPFETKMTSAASIRTL